MPLKIDFECEVGGFWRAKRLHFGGKIGLYMDIMSRKSKGSPVLRKLYFSNEIEVPWSTKSIKIGSKIDHKMASKMKCILAPIFFRFWWISGGKLGGEMEPESIQKGIEKTMRKGTVSGIAKLMVFGLRHRKPAPPSEARAKTRRLNTYPDISKYRSFDRADAGCCSD